MAALAVQARCYDRGVGATLLQKVWDLHTVRRLPNGQTQLYVGLHLVHEVTSPQAFEALRARGWPVITIEGDHNPHWRQPEALAKLILELR